MFLLDIFADTIFPLVPLILILLNFKKVPGGLKIIFWYLFISLIIMVISNLIADRNINNLFLYHLATIVTFFFTCIFFYTLKMSKLFNRVVLIVLLVGLCFMIIDNIFIEPMKEFDTNAILFTSTVTIVFSIAYFALLLTRDDPVIANSIYSFWIISGFFIYSAGTFVIFFFLKYRKLFFNDVAFQFWEIQDIILILRTIFFITAIAVCIRKKRTYPG
jgi:hypothetical protein